MGTTTNYHVADGNGSSNSSSSSRRKRRVVLFPCPYQGHLNPMMQLATLLYTKGGFSITVIHTLFNSPNPSNYPHFHFEPISDGINISPHTQADLDIVGFLTALNVNCVDPFRACLLRLLSTSSRSSTLADEEEENEDIACIIVDAAMHFTQAVADGLQIPRLVLRTNSAASFLAFSAYPLLLQKGYLPIRDSELDKPVKELPPLKVKDLPVIPVINTKYSHETSYELIAQIVDKTRSSSGIILNSFEHLEQPALDVIRRDFYPTPVFPVGPFHKWSSTMPSSSSSNSNSSSLLPEDHSCIAWLDKQAPKSVIYVSFGSLADMHELELVETAWGLFNSGHPFLWVVRPGLVRGHQCNTGSSSSSSCSSNGDGPNNHNVAAGRGGLLLPDRLVELEEMIIKSGRGWLVKWAPQQQVLVHPAVGGFWTHNGWNSTLESLCQGVPMLCQPFFGDQMVNARYVSDVWKVGFQFNGDIDDHLNHHIGPRSCTTPRLERREVERAIKRLMGAVYLQDRDNHAKQEDDEMMLRVWELKEKADLSLKEGGSSFQSIESLIHLISSF